MVPNMQILRHTYFIICLLAALFVLPAFFLGPHGGDSLFHLVWSQEFAHEFWRGNLYPRWLSRMNSGCGGPDFFYYYPLPYYLTTLFSFLDSPKMPGWYPLLGGCWVTFSLMGIFCHLWLSSLMKDKTACFCGALVYVVASVCIYPYEGFTYSSITPFIWLPLLLYYAQRMAGGKRHGIAGYAVATAGLYTSSITGTIGIAWVPVVYFFFYTWRNQRLSAIGLLSVAVILGTLLAAIYLLPLLEMRQHMPAAEKLTVDKFHYTHNFLIGSHVEQNGSTKFFRLIFSMCFAGFWVLALQLWKRHSKEVAFWLGIASITFFMMTSLSTFVWEWFPILQLLQFPERFGQNIFPAILALFVTRLLSTKPQRPSMIIVYVALAIGVLPSSFFGFIQPKNYYDLPKEFTEEMKHDPDKNEHYYCAAYYQYRRVQYDQFFPSTVGRGWTGIDNIHKLNALCSRKVHVESGSADIRITEWRSRHIELQVNASAPSSITISQFNFPGWIARNVEYPAVTYPITLSPEGAGLVTIAIPPGQHRILLEMPTSSAERYGAWLSAFALTILIGMLIHGKMRGRTTASP